MAKQKVWYGYWLGKPTRAAVFPQENKRDQYFLSEYDGLLAFKLGAVEGANVEAALEAVRAEQWLPLPRSLKTAWYGFWIGEENVSINAAYPTMSERDANFTRRYDGSSEYILGVVPAADAEEALELVEADKWVAYTQRT